MFFGGSWWKCGERKLQEGGMSPILTLNLGGQKPLLFIIISDVGERQYCFQLTVSVRNLLFLSRDAMHKCNLRQHVVSVCHVRELCENE